LAAVLDLDNLDDVRTLSQWLQGDADTRPVVRYIETPQTPTLDLHKTIKDVFHEQAEPDPCRFQPDGTLPVDVSLRERRACAGACPMRSRSRK
jgi:hypothetical protein